jgi:hypothetical protein
LKQILFFSETWFSKKDGSIKECLVKVADPIVNSLNRRHIAFFNLQRLNSLDTIGMVLYKRIFEGFTEVMVGLAERHGRPRGGDHVRASRGLPGL